MVLNHRYQLGKDYRLAMVPAGKLCRLPSINESATGPRGGRLSIAKALEICWSKKPLPAANAPIGPTGYDTAIDHDTAYQDGSLHIRKVWARR